MQPDVVRFVKMFKMSGGGTPNLTLGKIYPVKIKGITSFAVLDDKGNTHWFYNFFECEGQEFKTEDYFEVVI